MSDRALEVFTTARDRLMNQNFARNILLKIRKAKTDWEDAGERWPFELLQNALDAGARAGRDSVSVEIGWEGDQERPTLLFCHDGAPFTGEDLSALLSGGSNKEVESAVTTGRFGTGFLVTHVLSTTTRIGGLLLTDEASLEWFDVELDRAGDQERILANTQRCAEQLRAAAAVDVLDACPWSARFAYATESPNPLRLGLDAVRQALPFLYATCRRLGRVRLRRPDGTWETWDGGPEEEIRADGAARWVRRVLMSSDAGGGRALRVLRVGGSESYDGPAALLVVEDGRVVPVREGMARAYRRFPLRGSRALPIAVAIDGPYEVDQERTGIEFDDRSREHVTLALQAVRRAAELAADEELGDAHLLARVEPPTDALAVPAHLGWWTDQLRALAGTLARTHLVEIPDGRLPAVSGDGPTADFPIPRLFAEPGPAQVPTERVRMLLAGTDHHCPPRADLAEDWTTIAEAWHALGVEGLNRIAVADLARFAADQATGWAEMPDVREPASWLLDLLDAVGACWEHGIHLDVLKGLVPDQVGTLRDPGHLEQDDGISEPLKDIAASIGIPIRSRLVRAEVQEAATHPDRGHLATVLAAVASRSTTPEQVVEQCVQKLQRDVPDGKLVAARRPLVEAAGLLARFLWDRSGVGAAATVRQLPLPTSDGAVARGSPERRLMAPVAGWPEAARPFADAYPPDRVVHDSHAELADVLVGCGVAWPEPLVRHSAAELKTERLRAMARNREAADGVVAKPDGDFSYIALLHPELRNRAIDPDCARALLGLILCHVARSDTGWRTWRMIAGRHERADVSVEVRDALWIGDVLGHPWVPTENAEGKRGQEHATPATIEDADILDPAWLKDNRDAVELLTTCLGFDALHLSLLSTTADGQKRQALRDELARVVDHADGDAQVIAAVAQQIADRHRHGQRVQALRDLGLAVQDAVAQALRDLDLLIDDDLDRGFDLEVSEDDATEIDELSVKVVVRSELVEVKCTVRDEVCMTPLQARTAGAEASRYTLCVVQLGDEDALAMAPDALVALVRERARFVPSIGADAGATAALVDAAVGLPVGLKNQQHLRYTVPSGRWASGLTLDEWVDGRFTRATETSADG